MKGIDAARGSVDFTRFFGILVMLNAQIDSGSVGRVALTLDGMTKVYGLSVLDNMAWTETWAGHEMGHGFGLEHSWAAGTPDVEYGDPWDIMSAFTFGGRTPSPPVDCLLAGDYDIGEFCFSYAALSWPESDLGIVQRGTSRQD